MHHKKDKFLMLMMIPTSMLPLPLNAVNSLVYFVFLFTSHLCQFIHAYALALISIVHKQHNKNQISDAKGFFIAIIIPYFFLSSLALS